MVSYSQSLALLFALLLLLIQSGASEESSNAPALKVNLRNISIREVETLFADHYVLIQDKLKQGELTVAMLDPVIRAAWTESLEQATQDAILDDRADKKRKEIIHDYLARTRESYSGDRALQSFKRAESDDLRRLRRELIAVAGGETELRNTLKRRGQTLPEWEAGLSRELFRRYVLWLELGRFSRSPAATKSFYEKHPKLFCDDEAWRLRRIRVAKSQFSSPAVALEAAKLVKEKLNQGADFAALAANVSADSDFAKQGGLLTKSGKTDLPSGSFPEEERIAATLKDGECSDPLDCGEWLVIIQRAGYRPGQQQTFEQAYERAESLALAEKLKELKHKLFKKLKHESYIEILQKDPPASLLKSVKAATPMFILLEH
ncbi:MAG: peptidylprolyl isomerase [Planctomycetota bacterium]